MTAALRRILQTGLYMPEDILEIPWDTPPGQRYWLEVMQGRHPLDMGPIRDILSARDLESSPLSDLYPRNADMTVDVESLVLMLADPEKDAGSLAYMFNWSDTPQGYGYWLERSGGGQKLSEKDLSYLRKLLVLSRARAAREEHGNEMAKLIAEKLSHPLDPAMISEDRWMQLHSLEQVIDGDHEGLMNAFTWQDASGYPDFYWLARYEGNEPLSIDDLAYVTVLRDRVLWRIEHESMEQLFERQFDAANVRLWPAAADALQRLLDGRPDDLSSFIDFTLQRESPFFWGQLESGERKVSAYLGKRIEYFIKRLRR